MDSTFMMELEIRPFVKYVVLKVDLLLETEIVDEGKYESLVEPAGCKRA